MFEAANWNEFVHIPLYSSWKLLDTYEHRLVKLNANTNSVIGDIKKYQRVQYLTYNCQNLGRN